MIIWEIHYEILGVRGEGVYHTKYKRKGYAKKIGKQLFGDRTQFRWWLVGRPLFRKTEIVEKEALDK